MSLSSKVVPTTRPFCSASVAFLLYSLEQAHSVATDKAESLRNQFTAETLQKVQVSRSVETTHVKIDSRWISTNNCVHSMLTNDSADTKLDNSKTMHIESDFHTTTASLTHLVSNCYSVAGTLMDELKKIRSQLELLTKNANIHQYGHMCKCSAPPFAETEKCRAFCTVRHIS